jgi:phenylpropionate dioxygenase-like ring-hydroxylating dioxygenase large terminal subunit
MQSTAAMFDPRTYDEIRKPSVEASTLPPHCYTSEEFYRAEVRHMFMKVWNFIGRADRIPNVGDYFAIDYVGVPLIIVRDRDGSIKAYANSCRHRGTRIIDQEMVDTIDNTRGFKCPYHAWVFGIDGALKGCPGMENTVGFDKSANGLYQVRIETWGGFLFVNFDPDASPLLDYLGDMPEVLAPYKCEELVCTRIKVHEVDCNWKTHIENAMEDYHVPTVHGSTLNLLKVDHFNVPTQGAWFNMRERHTGTRALLEEDRKHAFPLNPYISGHAAEGTNFVCINPSTMLGMTLDCVWYIELHPLGPMRTRVVVGSCFPKATIALPDFEERAKFYYKRWDKSIGEDNVIARLQQRGLVSPLAMPGRMSNLEYLIPKLGEWWINHTVDRGAATARA